MSFLARRKSTVPAATPILVNLLKNGPMTWKQLYEQGSKEFNGRQGQVGESSTASTTDATVAGDSPFASKSHFKHRVLPVLEKLDILRQHSIAPKKVGDLIERETLVKRNDLKKGMSKQEWKSYLATNEDPAQIPTGQKARSTTEFVWSIHPTLKRPPSSSEEGYEFPSEKAALTDERIRQYLSMASEGPSEFMSENELGSWSSSSIVEVSTLREIDEEVDSLERASEKALERMQGIYPVQHLGKKGWAAKRKNYDLQKAWVREDLTDPRVLYADGGAGESVMDSPEAELERWKSTRKERVHLNTRRARNRVDKEKRQQEWWDSLQEAKAQGVAEATVVA